MILPDAIGKHAALSEVKSVTRSLLGSAAAYRKLPYAWHSVCISVCPSVCLSVCIVQFVLVRLCTFLVARLFQFK